MFLISKFLKSFENPIWLSEKWPWLYWKIYNFSWSNYYFLFENSLAKAALPSSAVGYFIYLNDFIAQELGFDWITSGTASVLGVSPKTKLYLLYFGLLFITFSRLLYLWKRPHSLARGPSLEAWTEYGLREFTYSDFLQLNHEINANGHRTRYGKYYDDDWDAFADDARWAQSGKTSAMGTDFKRDNRQHVNYSEAKARHEDLLRSILIDRYEEISATRKFSLAFAICLALAGYAQFLLPNIDLALTLIRSLF